MQFIFKSPTIFRWTMSWYPPYWGTGIWVTKVANDFRRVQVQMHSTFYNTNVFGSHFGGSLASMSDPFYALMLTKLLGHRYQVIDAATQIQFIAMAKGTVTADFQLDDTILNRIREKTSTGDKHHETFTVEIVDEEGRVVTSVEKTIYMRLKRHARNELQKRFNGTDDLLPSRRSRL
ncbi:hypothetical protein FisN_2Lh156 [Fistulifera solaris]|uniref:DUF4442 domain-containing protein n=1 Tax=Fistulifera solaris TaxID=1519565 RepID=A0A1Z5KFI7_FISSO|nr:hypothetical protein FisN_2Lh156 [Fistulifera solaris]|eukprot:GAX24885.1 hypothetical protein FisN_2Lh156 [Fistulifera solaris]